MINKYRMKNKSESIDIDAEVGDIKDAQQENGRKESKLERVVEWLIYLLIVFLLAWVAFKAPILR